jgi:cell division protein FtsQ
VARKKNIELSARHLRSERFMREKASKIRRQHFMQKFQIVFAIIIIILTIVGGIFVWKTSALSRGIQAISDELYGATMRAGYSVQTLYLEGINRTPLDDINNALDIDKGSPILRLNLGEIRTRLEQIESIKSATIERALPNTLYVRITEREPVARWQYQGKIAVVDDNGVVMSGIDLAPYKELPLIVGEGAPKHLADLLNLLIAEPELSKRFTAAIWVGQRRWNIRLQRKKGSENDADIEILLPEKNSLTTWKQLAERQNKEQILDRDIKLIDLRIEGRLFIKVIDGEKNSKPPPTSTNPKDI